MTRLEHVNTDMSLHALAYNLKRVVNILRTKALIASIKELMLRICYRLQLNRSILAC